MFSENNIFFLDLEIIHLIVMPMANASVQLSLM